MSFGNISMEELIRLKAVQHDTISVVIEDSGGVIIRKEKPPEDYIPEVTKDMMMDIYKQMKEMGVAYIGFDGRNSLLSYKKPLIPIIFNKVEFVGYNGHNTPILKIDGVECSGYKVISDQLFGYYRKDIKEVVKPFLIKEFNPEQLQFVEWRKVKGNIYPVYKYGSSKKLIKGAKGLKAEFPQLTDGYIKTLEPKNMEKPLPRHEELIKKFDLYNVGERYEIGGEIYLDSKRKVIAYIREQGESISTETAKKMFEVLDKKNL